MTNAITITKDLITGLTTWARGTAPIPANAKVIRMSVDSDRLMAIVDFIKTLPDDLRQGAANHARANARSYITITKEG